ncbi:MAG: Gfo/Idh/MocA family oxidoreductase [Planctomycetota bacterium]
MSRTHRVGIVGVGAIADFHARAIADLDNAEVVAACCRTEAKGRAFCDRHGGDWYPSPERLLDEAGVDVITICTPSGVHLEPAVAALDRGVHVLCEKPLEIDLARAGEIIAAAGRSTARLGGIFPQRFNPVVRAAHEAASAGRLGQVAAAVAYVPWWRDDEYYGPSRWQGTLRYDGGGALMNQSIHAVDAILWLADAAGAGRPVEVTGLTAKRGHAADLIEVEDVAVATVRFSGGAVGVVLASTAMWPGTAMRCHIAGRDGTIEVHEKQVVTWRFRDEGPDDEEFRKVHGPGDGHGGAADPLAIDYSNHTRNIADFLAAIDSGEPSGVEADQAWQAVALIRAIYESAESGEPTPVAPFPSTAS